MGAPLMVIEPTLVDALLRTAAFSRRLLMSIREVRPLMTSPADGTETWPIRAWTNPLARFRLCLPWPAVSCFPDQVYWTSERLTTPGTDAALIVLVRVLPWVPSHGMDVWLTPPNDSTSPTLTSRALMVVRKTPAGTGSLMRLVARPSSITVLEPSTGLSTWILRAKALDSALCALALPCLLPSPRDPRPGMSIVPTWESSWTSWLTTWLAGVAAWLTICRSCWTTGG